MITLLDHWLMTWVRICSTELDVSSYRDVFYALLAMVSFLIEQSPLHPLHQIQLWTFCAVVMRSNTISII